MADILQTIIDFFNSDTPDNIIIVTSEFCKVLIPYIREVLDAMTILVG